MPISSTLRSAQSDGTLLVQHPVVNKLQCCTSKDQQEYRVVDSPLFLLSPSAKSPRIDVTPSAESAASGSPVSYVIDGVAESEARIIGEGDVTLLVKVTLVYCV